MKIKIAPIIVSILFLVFFVIFFLGLKNTNIYVPSVKYEKEVPFFTTQLFNTNKKINSDEIFKNDKYYLMNIWSSWCIPCRDEHPFLLSLKNEKPILYYCFLAPVFTTFFVSGADRVFSVFCPTIGLELNPAGRTVFRPFSHRFQTVFGGA